MRAGIGWAVAGHGVAVVVPALAALLLMTLAGPTGTFDDGTAVYVLGAVVAQLLLAAAVVRLGVLRTARRDGANAVGLALGWLAGAPPALIVGIAIAITLAL